MRVGRWSVVACVAGLLSWAQPIGAQLVRAVRVEVDNDFLNVWVPPGARSDHGYTHGMRIAAELRAAPALVRGARPDCVDVTVDDDGSRSCASASVVVGQEIYTPAVDRPTPVPGDRPYAALLYTDLHVRYATDRRLRAATLRIGTTGPAAHGATVQSWFHQRVLGFPAPRGWEHQLASQPVLLLTYEERRQLVRVPISARWAADVAPIARAEIGNLGAGASVGADARAGYHLPHPWRPRAGEPARPRVYLRVGGAVDWTAHDLLLEGNSPTTRDLVRRRPLVPRWHRGIAVEFGPYSVQYLVVTRGRQFETALPRHTWSSVSVGIALDR